MNAPQADDPVIAKVPKIERWRFDKLRLATAEAMTHMADVLRDLEDGNWIGEDDRYHRVAEAISVLAIALHEATE